MYDLIGDMAYHYSAKCSGCQREECSETILRKSIPGIGTPERARQEKEFSKHLEQRGWHLLPPLCKGCCDHLVITRVGNAFKEALTEKAGVGR